MPPNVQKTLYDVDTSELANVATLARAKQGNDLQAPIEGVVPVETNVNQAAGGGDDWENVVDLEATPTDPDNSNKSVSVKDPQEILSSSRHEIRNFIRKQSTCLSNGHRHASVDEARLSQAAKDAGFYAFGIMAVEVWVLDEDRGLLERPNGGWWSSEFLEHCSPVLSESEDDISKCMPGVGLAGVLWSESAGAAGTTHLISRDASNLSRSRHGSTVSLPDLNRPQAQQIRWRDIKSLLEDPDTPKDTRFNAYLASGFGLAVGVPFQSFLSKGLVVYLARPTADMSQINTVENRVFLECSAYNIGSVIASSHARRACLMRKQILRSSAFIKVQHGLEHIHRSVRRTFETQSSGLSVTLGNWKKYVTRRFRGWTHKCRGGDLQIPPAMTWDESFYTLLGCFVGLLILSTMNELALDISDNNLSLLLGPFGALMTLLFGLSSAPASQPRNVILGQVIAGAISMAFTYIPESIMSTWMRQAVGPAFAITAMVKLGIPHPPAGAHSVMYASGLYGWKFYFLVVLASIISVAPATMVNNLSDKRQYPTFWGYLPKQFVSRVKQIFRGKGKAVDGPSEH